MKTLVAIACAVLASAALAQSYPAPQEGTWVTRNFRFHTGEVLPVPAITPVPLTKPWFLGIANVRGALHGVVDFAGFIGTGPASAHGSNAGGQARLLLLGTRFSEIRAGLVVDRVLGEPVVRVHTTQSLSPASDSRSRPNARRRRDFTVPSGMPSAAATSDCDRPWK